MLEKTDIQTIIEVNPVNHLHKHNVDKHNVRFATQYTYWFKLWKINATFILITLMYILIW